MKTYTDDEINTSPTREIPSIQSVVVSEVDKPRGLLAAQDIQAIHPPIVTPFFNTKMVENEMSYGLGPAGYDIRIAEDLIMWPGRFALASSIEKFRVPDDILGQVTDKSSWARRGITVQNTVIEPGWSGYLTIELVNHSWKFVRIRKGSPIAQILFTRITQNTDRPYNGKYQCQERGPQKARKESDYIQEE